MNDELAIKIQAWIDGELSSWQSRRMAALLERDPEAKALATELRQTKAALAGNEMSVAVPELRQFYWNKLRLEIERQAPQAERQRRREQSLSFDPLAALRRFALPLAGVAVVAAVAMLSMFQVAPVTYDDITTTSNDMSALTFHDQSA